MNTSKRRVTNDPTFGDIITLYQDSAEFRKLKPSSQRAYAGYLKKLKPVAAKTVSTTTRYDLVKSWENSPPHAQANAARITSRMIEWATSMDLLQDAPPAVRLPRPKGKAWEGWTDSEIARFRKGAIEYSNATNQQFVKDAFEIALATGQRFGDVCGFLTEGWDGEFFKFRQGKTGTLVTFKPSEEFKLLLEQAVKRGDRFVLEIPPPNHGREARLRYHFDIVRETTGVDKTFHGLRKTVAIKLREAGASDAQIAALLGHRSTRMVERYAAGANQVSLASAAADLLSGLYEPTTEN